MKAGFFLLLVAPISIVNGMASPQLKSTLMVADDFIKTENFDRIDEMLDSGFGIASPLDSMGNTLVHRACYALGDHYKVVEHLIKRGADISIPLSVNESSLNDALTPLHIAISADNHRCAKVLIEHGANVNCVTPLGVRPLHKAFQTVDEESNEESIQMLLDAGARVKVSTRNNSTPRSLAMKISDKAKRDRIIDLLKKKRTEQRKCSQCSISTNQLCAGCEQIYYCSEECQKKDWKNHKPECIIFKK